MSETRDKELLDAARKARDNAYAPYSNYQVGAAIRSLSGEIFTGCNVENAAYPQGQCAEAGAIAAMVRGGQREILEVAITGPEGGTAAMPCGGCRQRLRELGADRTVIMVSQADGSVVRTTLGELLPMAFGPDNLKNDGTGNTKRDELIAAAGNAKGNAEIARRCIGLLDYTSLNDDDTPESIAEFVKGAITPHGNVAAVCVYPQFVRQVKEAVKSTGIRVVTTCNFPHGGTDIDAAVAEAKQAVADDADEIDMVLPFEAYKAGDRKTAMKMVAAIRRTTEGRTMKVILETAALGDRDIIAAASRDCISAGADFIKTSTGKIEVGATLEASAIMLNAIANVRAALHIGFKPSGGIRTVDDAAGYLYLAERVLGADWISADTFRFGASGLLKALVAEIEGSDAPEPGSGY